MTGRVGFTIEESARRLGHYRWVSLRLFGLLGAWVPSVPEPDVKVRLAASSRHHGWHAEQLGERLPDVRELHPDRQTVPPATEMADWFDEVAEMTAPVGTAERLALVYRVVVPHLASAIRWHRERTSEVADAAVRRTLGFVHADLVDDWMAAEETLQRWSLDPDVAARLRDIGLRFEPRWTAIGGIAGPSTWVEPGVVKVPSSSDTQDVDAAG